METVVIRLKAPIRVGYEQIPNNAVIEVEAGEANKLLEYDPPLAEETDAIERYPVHQPILKISDFPIWGNEKFPRDTELIPPPHPSAFTNDIDRHIEHNIRGGGGAGPASNSKEPIAARVDESTIDQSKVKEEQEAAAAARVAGAVPMVMVEPEKPAKAKH